MVRTVSNGHLDHYQLQRLASCGKDLFVGSASVVKLFCCLRGIRRHRREDPVVSSPASNAVTDTVLELPLVSSLSSVSASSVWASFSSSSVLAGRVLSSSSGWRYHEEIGAVDSQDASTAGVDISYVVCVVFPLASSLLSSSYPVCCRPDHLHVSSVLRAR